MNKLLTAFVLVATMVAVLMSASFVFAQSNTPAGPQTAGSTYGYGGGAMMNGGMRGGRGAMGNGGTAVDDGILHDAMIAVYAEKLGISVADLNTRLDAGETMAQIAYAEGLSADEFTALMTDARSQAIEQAVAAGTLTQEQADWMQQRGMGVNGARGAGRGMRANSVDCPYYPQTNP